MIPSSARVIVVGGGIVGASVAYHLTKLGWSDVLLLEQNALAGGTTWHAAGLVGQLRTSNSMTKINKYSVELYPRLETETGVATGWKTTGSLIVATSSERMIQLERTMAMAELFGVKAEMISPDLAFQKWGSLMRVDDVIGAAWLPDDGKCLPKETALALAKGAQLGGAKILEHVRVLDVLRQNGRVTGVRTDDGDIAAEFVVLCGGMWTRELGLKIGVNIPLFPVEHHYVVSEPIDGAFDGLPVGRDPNRCIYYRGEGNKIMLGAFQAYTKPWDVQPVPNDFSNALLEPDWAKYTDPLAAGKWRIPALEKAKFEKFVNGPESFTPDNNFLMGETPELHGLFVMAGFNSVGIASAGGAGKYLAEWIVDGEPSIDLWSVDIQRFGAALNNRTFLRDRVTEVLGLHYQMAYPNREPLTGRNLRLSPLHYALEQAGACFGQKAGFERPNWFARDGLEPVTEYAWGRQNWFGMHKLEHDTTRQSVAVFDQSAFAKLEVIGRDALTVLQRLCSNQMDVPIGKAVYTAMPNQRGGFESDLTVLRLSNTHFRIITGSSQAVHDTDWIRRNLLPHEQISLTDVTESYAVIGLMGAKSRDVLKALTTSDMSHQAFGFGEAKYIEMGYSRVLAVRITYVGELGWELHIPNSQATQVYADLMRVGSSYGIENAGHYAINSLRLEKGYRAWGADISPEDTILEAGLGFAVDWNKEFIGKTALLEQKKNGLTRMLVSFVLNDPEPMLWGSEPILRDGVAVGYTTSGSYGHTLGAAIGMGYVKNPNGLDSGWVKAGQYEIVINGKKYATRASLRSLYDPERQRILQ
ncbi:MAG: Aminomethyltransferase [Deinococcota bacterium]|jgi:glycine cleavage system aminomethyltransferase T/glycine/D-amino acid oxidase-like deaminating enzyme